MPRNLRLSGLILALALGFTTLPSMANMSAPTNGRIHGQAPDVTGTPVILMPDGTTPVINNAQVLWSAKTSDFTLAPLSSYVTYVDADGDLPLGVGYSTPPSGGVAWMWTTAGGTLLTAAQLSQPFQTNFTDGTVLKVTVSQDVDVASVSGLPNTRARTLHSGTFDVVVKKPLAPPKVYVGGTKFDGDAGFPTTGFPNASFQFYMNGTNASTNGNYTYSSNQSWVTVTNGTTNTAGKVTFTGTPTSSNKTVVITITDKSGISPPMMYQFTLGIWFTGTAQNLTVAQSVSYCAGKGEGYAVPDYLHVSAGDSRQPRSSLWQEWGNSGLNPLKIYNKTDGRIWTNLPIGNYTRIVQISNGWYGSQPTGSFSAYDNTICSRSL